MKKFSIKSNHEIGKKCRSWAMENMPDGWKLATHPEDKTDVVFSIFSREILDKEYLWGKRAYNFHGGKLPEYKGSCTFNWAIMNGETETSVTLHELIEEVDAGEIIDEFPIIIEKTDDSGDVFDKACDAIFHLFKKNFLSMLNNDYETRKHVGESKMYYKKDFKKRLDITDIVRGCAFHDKQGAYFINKKGEKINIEY